MSNFTLKVHSQISLSNFALKFHSNFTFECHSQISLSNFALKFHSKISLEFRSRISLSNFALEFRSRISLSNFALEFRSRISISNFALECRSLFQSDYEHLDDYATYLWASTDGDDMGDGSRMHRVTFAKAYLEMLKPGSYYLSYYSSQRRCFVGFSDVFRVSVGVLKLDQPLRPR